MAHGIFWSRAVVVLALAASYHGATHEVRLSDRHSFSCGTPPYCTGLVGAPNKGTLLCYCQVIPKGRRLQLQFQASCARSVWHITNTGSLCPEIQHSCAEKPILPKGYLVEELPNGDLNYTCWSSRNSRPVGNFILSTCFRGKWTRDSLPNCERIDCGRKRVALDPPLQSDLLRNFIQPGYLQNEDSVEFSPVDHSSRKYIRRKPHNPDAYGQLQAGGYQHWDQTYKSDGSTFQPRNDYLDVREKRQLTHQASCGPPPYRLNERVVDFGYYADFYCCFGNRWHFTGRALCLNNLWAKSRWLYSCG
ncbi:uncharacterized protein LOC111265742 isoform X2 [Varroa jacobsoni]|uniref:uncharacterized protein LOC111265742 isoform X2 n=1 Tax=Varroa jacobsoni TaxID=62625 RepID=UPI000BF37EDF|nr:uncharacterized protein LOC111265742 isoform X2 [Varroa jacobsoni]